MRPTVGRVTTISTGRRRIRDRLRNNWIDIGAIAVAGILFASGWPTLFEIYDTMSPVAAPVVAAAMFLPVALARFNPLLGWVIVIVTAIAVPLLWDNTETYTYPWHPGQLIALLVLLFAVAVRMSPAVTLIVVGVTSGAALVFMPGMDGRGWMTGFFFLGFAGYLVQRLVSSRRQLADQTARTRVERELRAGLEEKARIARDLHDVVAHHMSLVVVAAQTAPYRHAEISDPVRAEFDTIAETARTALDEVRGILGVLRTDEVAAPLAPQPGLAELDDLVEAARRAGVEVSVAVEGIVRPVDASTGLAAYRCVQEALANAGRHAPGQPVAVSIGYGLTELTIRVTNPMATSPVDTGTTGGHGVRGMSDRIGALGGVVSAGPVERDGRWVFGVLAHLPIAPVVGAAAAGL